MHRSAEMEDHHHEARQQRRSTWTSAQLESRRGSRKSVEFKKRDLNQVFGLDPKEKRFVGKTKVFTVVPCEQDAEVGDSLNKC